MKQGECDAYRSGGSVRDGTPNACRNRDPITARIDFRPFCLHRRAATQATGATAAAHSWQGMAGEDAAIPPPPAAAGLSREEVLRLVRHECGEQEGRLEEEVGRLRAEVGALRRMQAEQEQEQAQAQVAATGRDEQDLLLLVEALQVACV